MRNKELVERIEMLEWSLECERKNSIAISKNHRDIEKAIDNRLNLAHLLLIGFYAEAARQAVAESDESKMDYVLGKLCELSNDGVSDANKKAISNVIQTIADGQSVIIEKKLEGLYTTQFTSYQEFLQLVNRALSVQRLREVNPISLKDYYELKISIEETVKAHGGWHRVK